MHNAKERAEKKDEGDDCVFLIKQRKSPAADKPMHKAVDRKHHKRRHDDILYKVS